MYSYYNLDIIPIILNRFKVNHVIISGLDDKSTINLILEYCDNNNASYTAIDFKDNFDKEFIHDYTLNILPDLRDYDAIFLNDDPNWYTVYNELNIIHKNNLEFPLVFICHNLFPHKRRDSYINPDIIPQEFRNEFSKKLEYSNVSIQDGFYHAINENTPKNGVLTAINDFLTENPSIGIMEIKLLNGITILYPKNNISKIRLGRLFEEIQGHDLEFDDLSDNIVENQILINYLSNLNQGSENLEIDDIKFELDKKEEIVKGYEEKIRLHSDELNYKNSQIEGIISKLDLKNSQIEYYESKLINRNNLINSLNNNIQGVNNKIDSLKKEIDYKTMDFNNKEMDFNTRIVEANSKIASLELGLSQKEQSEANLINQLEIVNNQIDSLKKEIDYKTMDFNNKEMDFNTRIVEANSKIASLELGLSQKEQSEANLINQLDIANNQIKKNDAKISYNNNYILIKDKELKDKTLMLDSIKKQYTNQLSKLDNKEYCISCYKEEINNNNCEIQFLNKNTLTRKLFSPFGYLYLIFKSNPKELSLNFKLYNALKNSKCFDIGYYLANNKDVYESNWCKYFSPELHYVCNGFDEKRKFNKKYFDRNSKKQLLDYILNCQ